MPCAREMPLRATPHPEPLCSHILHSLKTHHRHLVIMLFQESRARMALEARCLSGGTLPPSPKASADISKGRCLKPRQGLQSWNWGRSLRCHEATSLLLVVRASVRCFQVGGLLAKQLKITQISNHRFEKKIRR